MGSRRGGSGGWALLFWLVVVCLIVEIIKAILLLIGVALMGAVALCIIIISIYGLNQLFQDLSDNRDVLLKSIIPVCIICVITILAGPKVLTLFQKETGMLWWRRTETNYLMLSMFITVATPILFGFGYAFSCLTSRTFQGERQNLLS